jgi:hypothetical protein
MTPSLERLNELVRQAEARSRSKKLEAEAQQSVERLREAEQRARVAASRVREGRPSRLRQLEQADTDEQQLKELIKKLAQYKSALDPDSNPEGLVDGARAEIDRARAEARAALDELAKEADESRRALRAAMDHYQQIRRELDRLGPALGEPFAADDKLLWEAETHFPGGLLHALAREVESAAPFYGMLSRPEQYAQLKIWIGRYRRFQDEGDPEREPAGASGPGGPDGEGDEIQALAQRVFLTLKGLSKQYEPGYIDAFRLDFQADWGAYIAEAQAQLQLAVDAVKHARDREAMRGEQQARDAERQQQTREAGRAALVELKAFLARTQLPDEGLETFLTMLRQAVRGLGAADQELLELAAPWREHVGGDDLRALRRNLDKVRREEDATRDGDAQVARYEDLLSTTKGLRALMIGGAVREDARKSLQNLFGFTRLDWEPFEDAKPAALDSIEQRVKNRGVDLVILLRSFIGHSVSDRLRPACQQSGIPCLMVDRGYGPAQIGEALRRGLGGAE